MQFKHYLYWTAVLSGIGQVILALYARFYGDLASQIPTADELPADHTHLAVLNALNYALPVSVACIALLVYTWKINKVGSVALGFAIGLQVIATDLNLRAVRHVFGRETTLASVAWWAPADKTPAMIP